MECVASLIINVQDEVESVVHVGLNYSMIRPGVAYLDRSI
jgi:hypothetical protein